MSSLIPDTHVPDRRPSCSEKVSDSGSLRPTLMARSPRALPGLVFASLLAVLGGCSDSPTDLEDLTPPSRVTDLMVAQVTDHAAALEWTAPGDDEDRGRALAYDLRYDTKPLDQFWEAATIVGSTPSPLDAGTRQSFLVEGLRAETTYFFALRAVDDEENWAAQISNVASRQTARDTIPPARVTDLTASAVTHRSVDLTWTVPRDNWIPGLVSQYDLRCSESELTEDTWHQARRIAGATIPSTPGSVEVQTVDSLEANLSYSFGLRVLDASGNASTISNVVLATTSSDTVPPAVVTDLQADAVDHRTIQLSWTAPGDDGATGTAQEYEIRFSPQGVTEETWDQAVAVPDAPLPQASGVLETLVVGNLEDDTDYFFALKAVDEGGNWSDLSQVAVGHTPVDRAAPAAVADLRIEVVQTKSLALVWTAPGDDGSEGQAAGYDVRYSTLPITLENWDTATAVEAPPSPLPPGSRQSTALLSLAQRTKYYFALRTRDERGNWSPISNVVQGSLKPSASVTWQVKADGTGDAPTIQAAIDTSYDGDVVLVGPGTYYENINLRGKAIHLRSELGPGATILDGSRGDNSVVTCYSGELNDTVIEGFTITGGRGRLKGGSRLGGGIHCWLSGPTIRRNVVRGNQVDRPNSNSCGGGIYLVGFGDGPTVMVQENTVTENYASGNGAGIYIAGPCIVEDNTVTRNQVGGGDGAGLHCRNGGPVIIRRNLIFENDANDHGGGIYVYNSQFPTMDVEIYENIIIGNLARGADGFGGVDCSGGGIWMGAKGAYVHHNTIAFNRARKVNTSFIPCGGICEVNPYATVLAERNVIYRNENGGIAVYGLSRDPQTWNATFRQNLVYENSGKDISVGTFDPGASINLILHENVQQDPLFCVQGLSSRGEVAGISPALSQPFGIIGAVRYGTCGPEVHSGEQLWELQGSRYGVRDTPKPAGDQE